LIATRQKLGIPREITDIGLSTASADHAGQPQGLSDAGRKPVPAASPADLNDSPTSVRTAFAAEDERPAALGGNPEDDSSRGAPRHGTLMNLKEVFVHSEDKAIIEEVEAQARIYQKQGSRKAWPTRSYGLDAAGDPPGLHTNPRGQDGTARARS
jgi:hypothetical protein